MCRKGSRIVTPYHGFIMHLELITLFFSSSLLLFFEPGSSHVAQAILELLGLLDSFCLDLCSAGISPACYHVQLHKIIIV